MATIGSLADSELVGVLLDADADINLPADDGRPLGFSFLADPSQINTLAVLAAHGLDANARDPYGSSLLLTAAHWLWESRTLDLPASSFQRLAARTSASRRALQWLKNKGWVDPHVLFTNLTVFHFF